MGSFAGITTRNGDVSFKDNEEFAAGIKTIFDQGGMMNLIPVQLLDKKIELLKPAEIKDGLLKVRYNYFENDWWEPAGLDFKTGRIWSNKIGYKDYAMVILAAYYYESLLYEDISAVDYNGEFLVIRKYVRWINYVLHKEFPCKAYDPWPLFELFHLQDRERCETYDWDDYFDLSTISTIGYFEIQSVLYGTEKAIKTLLNKIETAPKIFRPNINSCFEELLSLIPCYKEQSTYSEEEQLDQLLQNIRAKLVGEKNVHFYESESILENIARNLYVTDAPAFLVKYIAEVYQKDFWELWEKISDVSRRRLWICPLEPLSTEGFFDITTDDRIFWWTEEEPLSFSQELQNWFSLLSDKYFEILSSDSPKLSIRIVMELLELSSEKHEFIIAFSTFFEETIDNIGDKRYAALWELYRLLLLESSFQDQCLSLFESSDTRENKPVKMLRRFHALAANRALRKTVFKF